MKDLFSECSALYQQARPSYPHSVISEILNYVPSRHFAWDCGAGSGQFTQLLAPYFEQIVATDMSAQQLHQAPYFENVSYQIQQAEQTTFSDHSFDLITVAQAIHWFDFDAFYAEVRRTLKKEGIIAVIGYGTLSTQDVALNQQIQHLYSEILKDDWDPERCYIDAHYQTIPFPFEILSDSTSSMQFEWGKAQLLGYLNTWTAVKHHRETYAQDPLANITAFLNDHEKSIAVEFPLFVKIGKLKKLNVKQRHNRDMGQVFGLFKMRRLIMG
ncbi:class I SAM-dependent methyltransferase [Acinetobacter sp. 187]|uniref:class I SAM-dependent methyltransferase n=1 Tax=Acinetobacter lanii TaxID=2715163 RepID=UPI00140CFAAA|nr:class I SAM-dependent methyltransferase [Acinetobacter lanii]NHC03774.1 class I SAM-dependent methyltransferase [Acinetobacter lanii]